MGDVDSTFARGALDGSSRFLWAAFVPGMLAARCFRMKAGSHAILHALTNMMAYHALIAYETCSQLPCILSILLRKSFRRRNSCKLFATEGRWVSASHVLSRSHSNSSSREDYHDVQHTGFLPISNQLVTVKICGFRYLPSHLI